MSFAFALGIRFFNILKYRILRIKTVFCTYDTQDSVVYFIVQHTTFVHVKLKIVC